MLSSRLREPKKKKIRIEPEKSEEQEYRRTPKREEHLGKKKFMKKEKKFLENSTKLKILALEITFLEKSLMKWKAKRVVELSWKP